MTIAIGFPCEDGVVLCADSQMTCRELAMKYEDAKIHTVSFMGRGNEWTVAVAYAGDEGVFKSFWGRVYDELYGHGNTVDRQLILNTIGQALETVHAESLDVSREYIDVICGISAEGKTSMHVGRRTLFYEEQTPAYIGIGNTSLLRFLAATLPLGDPVLSQRALLAGVYLVNRAKDFVDGCGGQTRAALIKEHGLPEWWGGKGGLSINRLVSMAERMHNSVEGLYEVLLNPHAEINILEQAVKDTRKCIQDFYRSV